MDEIVLCAIEISPVLLFWLVIFVNRSVITSVSQFGFVIGSATLLEWNPFGITDVQLYSNSSASVLIPIFVCSAFHCWLNTRRREQQRGRPFSLGRRDRRWGRAVSSGWRDRRRGWAFLWGASPGDVWRPVSPWDFSFPCSYSVSHLLGFRSVLGFKSPIKLVCMASVLMMCYVWCVSILVFIIRRPEIVVCFLFSSPLSLCARLQRD